MNKRNTEEYNRQLERNLQDAISEFNNKPEYAEIKQLYKNNFDKIALYIERASPKLAVQDIAALDTRLANRIIDNILLLQEINKAISQRKLTLADIK
jgi:hypothetical protein